MFRGETHRSCDCRPLHAAAAFETAEVEATNRTMPVDVLSSVRILSSVAECN